ncbi:MAG: CRTAC1 family protein, partial [Phycisphaerae bacterium]
SAIGMPRRYWQVVLADFDRDLELDIHAAIDFDHDFHCHGFGNGQFTDVSVAVGVANAGSDMGLGVGDIDNDGDLDIFSTNIGYNVLYVNDGAGGFNDFALSRGCKSPVGPTRFGWGAVFGDLDHDGDLDIVHVAADNNSQFFDPGVIYENTGGGFFAQVSPDPGVDLNGYALIAFDYDGDGDLDLLVNGHPTGSRSRLFENVSPGLAGNHWLVVEPQGAVSNRESIGAVVRVTLGGQTLMRPIIAGRSFVSGCPTYAHFGLGTAAVIDELRVRWPSGRSLVLRDVAVDQYLTLTEPPPKQPRRLGAGAPLSSQ